MRPLALLLPLCLVACSYVVPDPADSTKTMARCHDDLFNAFCVVETPPGMAAVAGVPMVPAISTGLLGLGTIGAGYGTVLVGVRAAR